jgi:hydrogenase maturation protein HypF
MTQPTLDAVVQDMHPAYDSRTVAKKFSEEFSAPLFDVQHHWAHAASLLVDNELDESVVIAVDGLGYGSDGTFWGGEVLVSRFTDFTRAGHLEPIPLLGGDQATKDPRRLVFAIFKKLGSEKFFSGDEARILSKLMDTSPQSTSLGRVLDALSCYLNICTTRTYDGEPAMKLEKYLAFGEHKCDFHVNVKEDVIGTADVFRQLDEQIQGPLNEQEKADYAFSFAKAIVDALSRIAIKKAEDTDIKTVGLTGGVSYNVPITEMVEREVNNAGLQLVVHHKVPNGDGGISIGQNAIIGHKLLA